MYKNCCRKCGSTSLHIEIKGNNTGLYCDDCHRKYNGWGISMQTSKRIAKEILENIGE